MDFKWDRRFLLMARDVAQWSKDPRMKVGAVLVRPDKTVVTVGYNGLPPSVDDSLVEDREFKNLVVLHAEENAILTSRDASLAGCTMYVWGLRPCGHCASVMARSGVRRVACVESRHDGDSKSRWAASNSAAELILQQAGVSLDVYKQEVVASAATGLATDPRAPRLLLRVDDEQLRPTRAHPTDSGLDLRANLPFQQSEEVLPRSRCVIDTGVYPCVPPGYELQVRSRSGLALKQGLVVLNSPGTVDSSYRGEIKVILQNHGDYPAVVKHLDKIAQMVMVPVVLAEPEWVNNLPVSDRGEAGFGSTGT